MRRGLTLIELLVVIGTIGLMSTLLLASMSTYRVRARDAARLSDIRQIQNALEIYYVENKGYPVCAGGGFCDVDCGSGLNADGYDGTWYENISTHLTAHYLPRVPPKLGNVCLWYWGDPGRQRYIVTFMPEEGSNILSNQGNQGCYEDGGDEWYCVGHEGPLGNPGR